ncbi:MAG: ribosome-associated translation inhibitor RaiA [Saprospiraceae bacterium]|jgi:ribosome-associated translation inhibitor RaiA
MVEQFCKSILQIVTRNSKALANLVMGLSSVSLARSVVEVSLSDCYHYQHSSINKVIDGLDKKLEKEKRKGDDGKAIKEDIILSRIEVEKKFTYKGGSFFKTV